MPDQNKYISKLQGSRALVIGGSSGIGYAVAEALLEHGSHVIISSSNLSRINQAIASLKTSYPSKTDRITGIACDMSIEAEIEANVLNFLSKAAPIDHIVYTAGNSIPPTPIAEATLDTIHAAATVRYTAPIFLAKHALKFFKPNADNSITLTTGVVSQRPMPNFSVIAGPRAAVIALAKNLTLDLKPIRVNVVSVGAVDTDTWSHLSIENREGLLKGLVEKCTTGRIARAEDVAEAYVYCMKDRNVTGSVVSTNGGTLLL